MHNIQYVTERHFRTLKSGHIVEGQAFSRGWREARDSHLDMGMVIAIFIRNPKSFQ